MKIENLQHEKSLLDLKSLRRCGVMPPCVPWKENRVLMSISKSVRNMPGQSVLFWGKKHLKEEDGTPYNVAEREDHAKAVLYRFFFVFLAMAIGMVVIISSLHVNKCANGNMVCAIGALVLSAFGAVMSVVFAESKGGESSPIYPLLELFKKGSFFHMLVMPGGMPMWKAKEFVSDGFIDLAKEAIKAERALENRKNGVVDIGYEWDIERLKVEKDERHKEYDIAVAQAIELDLYDGGKRRKHFEKAGKRIIEEGNRQTGWEPHVVDV